MVTGENACPVQGQGCSWQPRHGVSGGEGRLCGPPIPAPLLQEPPRPTAEQNLRSPHTHSLVHQLHRGLELMCLAFAVLVSGPDTAPLIRVQPEIPVPWPRVTGTSQCKWGLTVSRTDAPAVLTGTTST